MKTVSTKGLNCKFFAGIFNKSVILLNIKVWNILKINCHCMVVYCQSVGRTYPKYRGAVLLLLKSGKFCLCPLFSQVLLVYHISTKKSGAAGYLKQLHFVYGSSDKQASTS